MKAKGVCAVSVKPEFSSKDKETILHSDEAKMLYQLLQKDGGKGLAQATEALKKGEYTKAASILKPLLETPNSEMLMQELNRKLGRN